MTMGNPSLPFIATALDVRMAKEKGEPCYGHMTGFSQCGQSQRILGVSGIAYVCGGATKSLMCEIFRLKLLELMVDETKSIRIQVEGNCEACVVIQSRIYSATLRSSNNSYH